MTDPLWKAHVETSHSAEDKALYCCFEAGMEAEKKQQRRREQNLVLQACVHCEKHEGALVDCIETLCSEARAVALEEPAK